MELISREAAIAEVEEYLQGLDSCISEPDIKLDGYRNGLEVAIYELKNAPTISAIPVEWLENRRQNLILSAMVRSTVYGDNSVELCHAVNVVLDMWQKKQE